MKICVPKVTAELIIRFFLFLIPRDGKTCIMHLNCTNKKLYDYSWTKQIILIITERVEGIY